MRHRHRDHASKTPYTQRLRVLEGAPRQPDSPALVLGPARSLPESAPLVGRFVGESEGARAQVTNGWGAGTASTGPYSAFGIQRRAQEEARI